MNYHPASAFFDSKTELFCTTIPQLFTKKNGEYIKYLGILEGEEFYMEKEDIGRLCLLEDQHNDVPIQTKKMDDIWAEAQKDFFKNHSSELRKLVLLFYRGS